VPDVKGAKTVRGHTMGARGQHDDEPNQCRGNRAHCVRICWRRRLDAALTERPEPIRHGRFFQTDGGRKVWMTANLNVDTSSSYCYNNAETNCRQYGPLYTWESAQRGCQSLGDGWRLPTDDEWRQLAKHYGGLGNDSTDKGEAAYTALLSGGTSGFNAVLGGNRSIDGQYDRLEAHGIYWTASENDPITARGTTSPKAVTRSFVGPRAKSGGPLPCVASGSDRSTSECRDPIVVRRIRPRAQLLPLVARWRRNWRRLSIATGASLVTKPIYHAAAWECGIRTAMSLPLALGTTFGGCDD